ncbi:MAG: substrate-binding domain-containing protein [Pseudomonadota bacterium]
MPAKPTLETVAKEANVSVPTVSQVLRGTGRISETTRQKVMEAAKRLNYVRDSRAASMRSGDNREVGFLLNQLANPFNAEVVSGVVDLLEAEGYLVSILDAQDDPARQIRHLEAFIRNGRGGLLWVPAASTPHGTVSLLATHGIPTVTFLRPVAAQLDYVGIQNADAMAAATSYLNELGHRNIAYLGGDHATQVRIDRIAGYERMMSERGLGPSVVWPSPDTKLSGLEAMLALREKHPEVTAVVCNGDMVALGACLALSRLDLVPGREVSVIGFDDIQDAAVATPPLTTMAVSPKKLGKKLARTLLERIRDPEMPVARSETSAALIIRETTGPPIGS